MYDSIGPWPSNLDEIENLQRQRFEALIKHTWEKSEFYRSHWDAHGIKQKSLAKLNISDIPPVSKKTIRENLDKLVCDPKLRREDLEIFISDPSKRGKKYLDDYRICHTSGSTGQPGIFAYGPNELRLIEQFLRKRYLRNEEPKTEKIKFAGFCAIDGHYGGVSLMFSLPEDQFDLQLFSINAPLSETVEKLNEFQPEIIFAYSSGVGILAQAQNSGQLKIGPRQISCGGDHLTQTIKEQAKQAWGITPKNLYACTESLGMATACVDAERLHLFSDWVIFEILGPDMKAKPPGEEGKLYLTNLYNYTQPLIRYETNDRLVLDEEPCPCKNPLPTLKTIAGRVEEFMWFDGEGGKKQYIHPITMAEFFVPGLKKVQMVQNDKKSFTLKVVLNDEEKLPSCYQRMDEILRENHLQTSVKYQVQLCQNIANDKRTEKYRLMVPNPN